MASTTPDTKDSRILLWFFGGPTAMILINFILFPYPLPPYHWVNLIPLFAGLILLGIGTLDKQQQRGSRFKMTGWILFALFWTTYTNLLYFSEGGDIINAAICVIGIYVLIYLAYHEWLSTKRREYPAALNWIAGATCLAGLIYFSIEQLLPFLSDGLILIVADQTVWMLRLLGFTVTQTGATITYNDTAIHIIFACTAVQSLLLFVGMLGAMPKIKPKRKTVALLATVVPVYLLNLVRNTGVVLMTGSGISFEMAHNVIGKAGSLLALIAILFLTFHIVPELYDDIMGVINLPKRKGPLEQFLGGKR